MMQHRSRWLVVVPMLVGVQLAGCRSEAHTAEHVEPAHVEPIDGTDLSRITLTDEAMERVDVHLGAVTASRIGGRERMVVSYGAIIYDIHGGTWVYTSPEPNTFVRAPIDVEYIDGDMAVLNDGPSVGTQVVTVGGGILHGTEFEVGH